MDERIYRVAVRGNLVTRMEPYAPSEGDVVYDTKLEIGTQLATNHRNNKSIDGDYLFSSVHVAKDFAVLSLDFVQKLTEKSLEILKGHNFHADPAWSNPFLSQGHDEPD